MPITYIQIFYLFHIIHNLSVLCILYTHIIGHIVCVHKIVHDFCVNSSAVFEIFCWHHALSIIMLLYAPLLGLLVLIVMILLVWILLHGVVSGLLLGLLYLILATIGMFSFFLCSFLTSDFFFFFLFQVHRFWVLVSFH